MLGWWHASARLVPFSHFPSGSMPEQQYDYIIQKAYNRIAHIQVRRHQRSQQAAFWTTQRAFEASNLAAERQDSRAASRDEQELGQENTQSQRGADVRHDRQRQETDTDGTRPNFTANDVKLGLDEDAMEEDEVTMSMMEDTEDTTTHDAQPSPPPPPSQYAAGHSQKLREQEQKRADAVQRMREVLDRQQAQRAAEESLRESARNADQGEGISNIDRNGDHIMGEGSLDLTSTFSSNFKRHIKKSRQAEVRKAAARRTERKQWEEQQRREREEQQRREWEEQQRREWEERQRREWEEQQRREREEQQRREREEQQRREREEQQRREREDRQRQERERREYASLSPSQVSVESLY